MPRKRTAAAMLIAEASAPGLLQPISSKRLRKAVGSYRELAGEGTSFETPTCPHALQPYACAIGAMGCPYQS